MILHSQWGLERRDGRLVLDGRELTDLAASYGTPLHVVSARTLRERCGQMRRAFAAYPGTVRLHFSYKTNPVAGVLRIIHGEGMGAEVVSGHEAWLARRLGVPAESIVFNGPNKDDAELTSAVAGGVGLIVADGLAELRRIEARASAARRRADVALRICPDVVPHGMNLSSLTGSRRSQFGVDPASAEAVEAIRLAARSPHLRLRGAMAHIGSGVHDTSAFARAVRRLMAVQAQMRRAGAEPDLVDVGGGLGTRLSREFTTMEMLEYFALGRLPSLPRPPPPDLVARYARAVMQAVEEGCREHGLPLPTIVLEPGRAVVSDAQVLLLRVGAVRERAGARRFALTDGGALTVSMMFLSERHAVLLANRDAADEGRTSVFGRLPSPLDVVYRGLRLPRLEPGDLLAVMDAGAYFTSTATNFGGPRPPVVVLDGERDVLVRRRETSEDIVRTELALDEPLVQVKVRG